MEKKRSFIILTSLSAAILLAVAISCTVAGISFLLNFQAAEAQVKLDMAVCNATPGCMYCLPPDNSSLQNAAIAFFVIAGVGMLGLAGLIIYLICQTAKTKK